MEFGDWLNIGMEAGWIGPPLCSTHDGTPTTEVEDAEYDTGGDPCIPVVRLYRDKAEKAAVEANHSPSVWCATNMDPKAQLC